MHGARLLLGAFLLAVVAACQPGAAATPTAAPAAAPSIAPATTPAPSATSTPAPSVAADTIVVTVSATGGECPKGPCGAEYVVYGDGRVDGPDGGPASIPPERVAQISTLAATTDWDAVRAVPFTGECPTAFDGQKHVYAFPARGGDVVLDSCEFDLSQVAVILAIDAALFAGG